MPAATPTTLSCFLLTRQWRDTPEGIELVFWGVCAQGPLRIRVSGDEAVCFIERKTELPPLPPAARPLRRQPLELFTLQGTPVDGLYFRRQRDLARARDLLREQSVALLESDIKPTERYLMERFVTASCAVRGVPIARRGYLEMHNPSVRQADFHPHLSRASLDIETSGLDGRLYSIALSSEHDERVFVVADGRHPPARRGAKTPTAASATIETCPDERGALAAAFDWLGRIDPDLILGWNVVGFDLDFLERKCRALGVPFALGRGGETCTVLPAGTGGGRRTARVPGRVVLDGIELLRTAFWTFESYDLETVARTLLGRGKRLLGGGGDDGEPGSGRLAAIQRLYREDPDALAAYNLEDCRLVSAIFERTDLIEFAMRRAQMTGLPMDRVGGSVAAFDHLYLPRLHRRGRVAPDTGSVRADTASPGGYVMDSQPGLYDNVLVLDFKSLYPSIIRTFRIDPLGLAAPGVDPVPGFLGARFARSGAILPELLATLWEAREAAKQRGDAPLAQAVKILMNSCYGVLGSPGCRFHDARLASSITRRGHEIIRASRDFIEEQGYPVIYGDTDSLFVLLGADSGAAAATGEHLAQALNAWWRGHLLRTYRLESCLEIQFERHYLRFFMPTIRGEQTGSKKRYAGLVRDTDGGYEVVFRGLESVRSDWTPLARRFQREVYRRVFLELPCEDYIQATLADLLAGRLDTELVYRKRVRRPLASYTRNVPPHVQAARKLERPGRWIRYVITPHGPEPLTSADAVPKPDYAHYRERQLAPAVDGILHFLGTSFAAITDRQLAIFT